MQSSFAMGVGTINYGSNLHTTPPSIEDELASLLASFIIAASVQVRLDRRQGQRCGDAHLGVAVERCVVSFIDAGTADAAALFRDAERHLSGESAGAGHQGFSRSAPYADRARFVWIRRWQPAAQLRARGQLQPLRHAGAPQGRLTQHRQRRRQQQLVAHCGRQRGAPPQRRLRRSRGATRWRHQQGRRHRCR